MNKDLAVALSRLASVVLLVLTCSCQLYPVNSLETILPYDGSAQNDNKVTFTGTVKAGADLGEVKQYCAEGLYLVADEGFLTGQTSMLLLRALDAAGQAQMLSDSQFSGKHVKVIGRYPAQEIFCEALICQCDDYILVERIEVQ
jgi:hypothetical protein